MSSEYNRSSLPLLIFDGENYDFWSIKMRTRFRSQNLWKIIEEGITIPEDITSLSEDKKKALGDNQQKDSHALYCLQQAMVDNLFPRIMSAATTKEAWDTLQEEFQGTVKVHAVRLQKLRRDFENLKMKDNETAKDYYSRIKEIVNQMVAYGEIISDKNIVQKILISCTEKYDSIVSVIKETKDLETLSPTELMGSLEACESRRERHKESEAENAFQSKINSRLDRSKTKVKIDNGDFMEAVSRGTIAIDTKKGKRYINDVLLVKMKENGCFPIQWRYASSVAMQAQTDESWLWHRRFGHFNFYGLKILKQKNMMRDLLAIKEISTVCEGCMLGKQHRQPFPSGKTWRAKKPLELVHTNVCGETRTPSNDQNRYFILFIDDFTRVTWFCEDEGMEHQLTVGYAPEQNSVSERKNRTVMEAARAMLLDKGLPKRFLVEAVSTAVYLLNRYPTKAVKNKTLIEAWSGRKPSAKHLKVFGCICYSHIPKEKKRKA
ncbi:uncharacterized protein LOC133039239 [Cannabis sativa]|uniref:uncharacterized protein LOC133039239 n=1 Tax=Cannabis sativa TaxID=3483 RepID=UPI0029CA92D4|nr:uncharacterized protein LOC133039239 [Cannabis sativa]